MKLALLFMLACAILACGQGGEAEQAQYSTAGTGIGAAVPFRGTTSLKERIGNHPTVVKARLTSVSAEVVAGAERLQGSFYVVLKFNLSVSEYLKGSGRNSITAIRVVTRESLNQESFDTRTKAEDAISRIRDARDTQWDDREAIFFLKDVREVTFPSLRGENRYFIGHPHTEDNYSIASELEKAWLPSASSSSATTGDSQKFLLDVPSPSDSTTPTITLGNLKQRITEVNAELNGGDGSEAYKECIKYKYKVERLDRYRESTGQPGKNFRVPTSHEFGSGQPTDTVLYEDELGGAYSAEKKAELRIDGPDSALFSIVIGDLVPYDYDGDGRNDRFHFDQSVVASRPLPAGDYRFNRQFTPLPFLACNHTLTDELTVTATAPAGVLHELFFDPVTAVQGQSGPAKVAADASNGVLEPASFTDANGASATIQSVSYEPPSGGSGQSGADSESGTGTVTMNLTTHTGLANHALDFIALDGSVSLSLGVDDATVDDANNTLSWSVSSQPWHNGDKLMLRIHKAVPAPDDVSASLSGGTYTVSWSAVTGAADYRAQYRTGGSEAEWTDLDMTTGTSQTFSPEGGVACGTTYEFRVQGRGDGTTYSAAWGKLSESASHTTEACNRAPVFSSATYSFTVAENAAVWQSVGTVSATDPDEGDFVTYHITAGNGAGRFDISSGSKGEGLILVWGALDYETTSSYTLTVEARDGKAGGTSSATVEITITDVAE
ncbi:MAG: hypothetical protein F4W93_07710 [Dehalococcoidia bacterium]|nr:hypothetical protein [Dehalococcoidia bacterium]